MGEKSEGEFETAIHSLYKAKFDIALSKNTTLIDAFNYKIDAEIRTLDFSRVDVDEIEELDEETVEEIMDSFKMMFSSGLFKGTFELR